jgi:Glutathione synthase/Ribosomal protein S6 modification enzyme (glutaminyl transferase)
LPPDHPLEPGSTSRSRAPSSSAERVAPAEAASEPKPPVIPDPGTGKPDFIAAARRAAQAASAGSAHGKNAAKSGAGQPKKLTERLRTLAVAAAVVVIVVGGFHIISRLFEDGSGSSTRIDMPSGAPPSQTEPPRTQSAPPQLSQTRRPARSRRTSRQSRSRRSTPRICWHRFHCPNFRKIGGAGRERWLDIVLRAGSRSSRRQGGKSRA